MRGLSLAVRLSRLQEKIFITNYKFVFMFAYVQINIEENSHLLYYFFWVFLVVFVIFITNYKFVDFKMLRLTGAAAG